MSKSPTAKAKYDHLQALYDAAWAECEAWRALNSPIGEDAEDAWLLEIETARAHHDALRAKGGGDAA